MYLYEGHLGSLYLTDYEKNFDDLYCEQCGDSDRFIGKCESSKEALYMLFEDINIENDNEWDFGIWDLNYVLEVLSVFNDCPDYEEAKEFVKFFQNCLKESYESFKQASDFKE